MINDENGKKENGSNSKKKKSCNKFLFSKKREFSKEENIFLHFEKKILVEKKIQFAEWCKKNELTTVNVETSRFEIRLKWVVVPLSFLEDIYQFVLSTSFLIVTVAVMLFPLQYSGLKLLTDRCMYSLKFLPIDSNRSDPKGRERENRDIVAIGYTLEIRRQR